MKKYTVIGNPIDHSLSPNLHNYWLKELSINGKYESIKTPAKNFKKTIIKLQNEGYKGVNLTLPLKEIALKYLNKKDKIVDFVKVQQRDYDKNKKKINNSVEMLMNRMKQMIDGFKINNIDLSVDRIFLSGQPWALGKF